MAKSKKRNNAKRGGAATEIVDKSKVIKGVALLLVVMAIAYVITSLALGGVWNPLKWTNKGKSDITVSGDEEPDKTERGKDGFLLVSNICDSDGIQMFNEMRAVENDVNDVLTVSVTPENADVFSVHWTSSDSAVAVTPINGEPMSAKLTLIHAFNAPVTITCNVVSATTLTATCQVDCLRAASNNVELIASNFKFGAANVLNASETSVANGTVSGQYVFTGNFNLSLSDEVAAYINNAYGYSDDEFSYDYSGTISGNKLSLPATPALTFNGGTESEEFRKHFANACANFSSVCRVEVTVNYVYNGKIYQTLNLTTYVDFDYSTYGVPANGATISPDNPILGT